MHPKKKFSQHFLQDTQAAVRIVQHLSGYGDYQEVLEIGPGLGALTEPLLDTAYRIHAVEIDPRAYAYLSARFGDRLQLRQEDVLQMDFSACFRGAFALIGNLPYAISSAIFFKILEARNQIPEAVCLVQEEVARRVASAPGSRQYGLLSVLLQAYYQVKYCYRLPASVFSPLPKVHAGLLQLQRLQQPALGCEHDAFVRVVKSAFAHRRKMLRNTLQGFDATIPEAYAHQRAEQLSVSDFVSLTNTLSATTL